jgi:tetratricopeptide (TPR) repeat protein
MSLILAYVLAAGAGVLIAHFISRASELRFMRLSQFILVPGALVLCVYFSDIGGMMGFTCFLAVLGFLAILLGPNIAYHCGAALSNFLDPHDWTPAEEEIALRPIQRLIDKDQYSEALADLEELLKKHKPTFEAVLIKAKLLHHFGSVDETVATLLSLIKLSKITQQQVDVMNLLALLEGQHRSPNKPFAFGARRIEIDHELILFQITGEASAPHRVIPPGSYDVEETFHRNHRWLKLAGEDWGNAEMCWEAVLAMQQSAGAPQEKGILWRIARVHQAISAALKGKSRIHRQAEAKRLLNEANQFIRRDDWHNAAPLLQQASACDPDRYEIAYRWMQAVRNTSNDAAAAQAIGQVLRQSNWTEHERDMLLQLKSPLPDTSK